MTIRELIDIKEECENKLECMEMALSYVNAESEFYGGEVITLKPQQAKGIYKLLAEYKTLLDTVINSVEVHVG